MPVPYRVFISAPRRTVLPPEKLAIKNRVIELIEAAGFEAELMGSRGSFADEPWTFDNVPRVVARCQGAFILGLAREEFYSAEWVMRFLTGFSHYEGAVAHMLHLPTLLMREDRVENRGIVYAGGGQNILLMPPDVDVDWLDTGAFMQPFDAWKAEVSARYSVLLGYSDGARATAAALKALLEKLGVRVMDAQTDFQPGTTVLERVQAAEHKCLAGIFLFTQDDNKPSENGEVEVPRDDMIFEAGYFMNTKGSAHTLLICEEGVKILSDAQGIQCLQLKDRSDLSTLEAQLRKFIDGL